MLPVLPDPEAGGVAGVHACAALDASLAPFISRASPLSEYAWGLRYPGEPDPSANEVEEALRLARQVYEAILQRLPGEAHPGR